MAAYSLDSLGKAFPLFALAVADSPNVASRHAWYAETARRIDSIDIAFTEARRALALEPCSSFAHTVLAALYNPQFQTNQRTNPDSTWAELMAAVRCDPSDGNPWIMVWIEATRRGSDSLARKALSQLAATKFITSPQLAYGRWVLENAPPGAILLTHGDLDTYPIAIAQSTQRVRPDVEIVNLGLLALPWYARRVASRDSLPLPDATPADTSRLDDSAIVVLWRRRAATGTLGRPLVIVGSSYPSYTDPLLGGIRFIGPGSLVVSRARWGIDITPLTASLMSLGSTAWTGPVISPADRSPVRRAGTAHPAYQVMWAAELLATGLLQADDRAGAQRWLDWAASFGIRSQIDSASVNAFLAQAREAIQPH